jgi:predicted ATPase/DNA-binding SARP family transcriptional activator
VRLLGLLEVSGPNGVLRLPGARQRAIVALLALRAPGVVSRPQLVDGLWGPTPPPTAVKTLHSHIARIRRALAGVGLGELLVTREPGYALVLPPGSLDLAAFGARLTAGRRAARAGHLATAAAELRAGLALWRGEPLADCPVDDWGQAEVARLRETMTGAAETLAETELALGEHGAAAGELERLVVSHPLRERLWELLIIAHHRGGHPAEALRAYRRARTALIDDLGVEPGPRLRELEEALLAGSAELDLPDAATRPAPAPVPEQRSVALAAARTSLVGRQRELSDVLDALAGHRVVTLTGPGGCGKTRLAVAAADRLPRAVALVDLTPVRVPELVADAVATALGVTEQPGADRVDTLVEALVGREVTVVLDNCEHLVRHGLPALVARLLTRCPELGLLATSREALGVAGERVYVVPPLAAPDPAVPRTLAELATYDSVRLFLDRAAEQGRPVPDEDARPVATLCAALDGLPLAIELAAARTPVLTPAQIVRRLRDRFGLLDFVDRAASPPHHHALGAALAWSHDLLSADEAALFARLGVFAGGFSVEGAEAVWRPEGALDALTGLVAKSLVRAGRTGASTRFFMLETIAAYAVERLAAEPVTEAVARERHAWFFLTRAEQAAAGTSGELFAELRADHENLRAAMSWFAGGDDRAGELRMATALSRYCRLHGHYRDGRAWLAHAIAGSGAAEPAARTTALAGAASLALSECDYDQASRHAAEALTLATSAGDQGRVGRVLVLLGAVARERAEYERALGHYRAAAAAFDADGDGDPSGVAYATQLAGATSWQAGDLDAAESALTTSLARMRERDDRRGAASSLAYLGAVALHRQDRGQARRLLDEALDVFGELEFTEGVAWSLNLLGLVEHGDGDHEKAERLLRASLGAHRELGDRWRQASVLEALAAVACALPDLEQAAALLHQADTLRAAIGAPVPLVERAALADVRAAVAARTRRQQATGGTASSPSGSHRSAPGPEFSRG